MLECTASVMIAIEPVRAPATILSTISAELETIDSLATLDFGGQRPSGGASAADGAISLERIGLSLSGCVPRSCAWMRATRAAGPPPAPGG